MIWIVSKSGMSAQFLEACINNANLQGSIIDTQPYILCKTECQFGYFVELIHDGAPGILKRTTEHQWRDEWLEGFEQARAWAENKGLNALFTHRHEERLIQWIIAKGDTVIRLRHVNHLPLWLCRESVLDSGNEKTVGYFMQKLKSRYIELDNLSDLTYEQPHLDQIDFLTRATRRLQKLAPCMNHELFLKNLSYYIRINLEGISKWDEMTELIIKYHSSDPLISHGYDDLIKTDLTF
tara:strand:- start:1168 stop:1881 length:714 start_codon:yes stop_codon:yes gene_type:complete